MDHTQLAAAGSSRQFTAWIAYDSRGNPLNVDDYLYGARVATESPGRALALLAEYGISHEFLIAQALSLAESGAQAESRFDYTPLGRASRACWKHDPDPEAYEDDDGREPDAKKYAKAQRRFELEWDRAKLRFLEANGNASLAFVDASSIARTGSIAGPVIEALARQAKGVIR